MLAWVGDYNTWQNSGLLEEIYMMRLGTNGYTFDKKQ
jgi:hypothetical protein